MTAPTRSQAEQALAALAHAIRPDWGTRGILAAIRQCANRELDQLAAAVLYAAMVRKDQLTPACIALDGEHWDALDRLTGKITGPPTPRPTSGCPYHRGQPAECPECARDRRQVSADPSRHIAAARQAIRDAKAARREDEG